MDIPADLQDVFGDLMKRAYAFNYKGKPVKFALKQNENTYVYFDGKNGTMYCYTPHPSTDGDYFVWDYVPHGKGARSGNAERYSMKNIVRCAHRNVAKARAIARWKKVGAAKAALLARMN